MITDDELAQTVWDYLRIGEPSKPSGLILCLGSRDLSVAERAIELYQQKLAPHILFSGGLGRFTKDTFTRPEAELYAEQAVRAGIPRSDILIENKSSNSGENITFCYQLLRNLDLLPGSLILVHKPYMERRALATFQALWPKPQPSCTVTSLQVSFAAYCERHSKKYVINMMVGDLQRIREYPKLGYSAEQPIPAGVWKAYEQLVRRGYTEQLLK